MKALFQNEQINFSPYKQSIVSIFDEEAINRKYIQGDVRIITEQARYPLNTIVSMVESPNYNLNPEFQRRQRWDNVKKSKLIESFIMNVPIPPVFLYETNFSEYEVMDGLQRMTAISEFYRDEFALVELEEWPELNGLTYSMLPDQVRKGIDRRYLSSIILLQETAKTKEEADRLKQLVFERINSGGEKLTPQETRNALFPGELNNLCIKLARHPNFCRMWNIPIPDASELDNNVISLELRKNQLFSKMQDVELVLRFFAYRQIESWESPSLEDFLDDFLKHGNVFPSDLLSRYANLFTSTCDLLYEIYGERAFWLNRERQGGWIYYERPTKVLYDPLMYVFSDLIDSKEILIEKKNTILIETENLHKSYQSVLGGRNTNRNDVLQRIVILKEFYQGFLS